MNGQHTFVRTNDDPYTLSGTKEFICKTMQYKWYDFCRQNHVLWRIDFNS